MVSYIDLKRFFEEQDFKLVIAADAETRKSQKQNGEMALTIPAGGVGLSFDPIAKAAGATYIARGKGEDDKKAVDRHDKLVVRDADGAYTLKRLFLSEAEMADYYYGFSNQTLWPLCHVAFERPQFRADWYEGYRRVNERFAKAIRDEIKGLPVGRKKKAIVWVNDFQLSLVPKLLGNPKNTIVSMFWHIPWPTWEAFRILPFKEDILESLLSCDFLAFHRGYHVRNFLDTVAREFEARIDEETNTVYFGDHAVVVRNLPMGIDTDVVKSLIQKKPDDGLFVTISKKILAPLLPKTKIILGVDRLDYTKGLLLRLEALDHFFANYPKYRGKVSYVGIIAPSREAVPAYQQLKKDIHKLADTINARYGKNGWKPIDIIYKLFRREEIVQFYQQASVCLVTPRDDGMNLVSKEFVVASSAEKNPGMLVLSTFAGSAIDLTEALIVNPYDFDGIANAIKKALEMDAKEKAERIARMVKTLDERNIYEWAKEFIEGATAAAGK